MKASWHTSLNNLSHQTISQKITATAYMDDTTWFACSKENLQKTLDIATSFFQLNDINTNNDKSALLIINDSTEDANKDVTLNYETISPSQKNEPVRILGIWVCASGKKKYQKMLIKERITATIKLLRWKSITDKQCRYIINQVLFLKIEYLLTDLVLTEQECNTMNSPIAKTFKHKARLPASTINSNLQSFWIQTFQHLGQTSFYAQNKVL
jgi:hypothetical protein